MLGKLSEFYEKLSSKYAPFLEMEGIGSQLDLVKYADEFFKNGIIDSAVDANANIRSTNVYTFMSESAKAYLKLLSLYLISEKIKELHGEEDAEQFIEQEMTGGIYVHDLFHSAFQPYCYAYSLKPIVQNGLQFIENIKSDPAKHLDTFIQHVIQFVMFASNQASGAVGLPDLFVWMWYYVKKDFESGYITDLEREVKQAFQVLTYSINQPIRGPQSPYVNLTYLDRNYIKTLFADELYPDGSKIVDQLENIIWLQKLYWEWIKEERKRQMFTFPVLTASFLFKDGEFVDEDSARFVNKVNLTWQDTNWYVADSIDALASCCRLQSSIKSLSFSNKLEGMMNSIGGSDLNIGSFKVVTINLPRIALEANGDEKKFFEILEKRVNLVMKTLHAIRCLIESRIKAGALPLYTHKLMNLERQYGTIGITGVWECAKILNENFTESGVDGEKYSESGEEFVTKLLDTILDIAEGGRYAFGFTFNIEQVPAEKAAVTLAEKDKLMYNTHYSVYSNQWIPLSVNTDMTNRILCSGKWDSKVNGGAILHINLGCKLEDEEEAFNLVKSIARIGVKYFAFNTKISVCANNHAFYGNTCPTCGKPAVDYFIRIVGYLVPSKAFNKTRREKELPLRQFY